MRLLRITPIDPRDSTLGISLRRYRGNHRIMGDGTILKPGTLIYEVHLLNNRFANREAAFSSGEPIPWEIARHMARDLRILAKGIQEGAGTEVLHGITLMGSGARRLGFSVTNMPHGLWRSLAGFYLRGLLQAYHFRSAQRLHQGINTLVPKEIWMPKKQLLSRYGPNSP